MALQRLALQAAAEIAIGALSGGSSFGASISGFDDVLDTFDTLSESASGDPTWVVGPTVDYAKHVEKGTSSQAAQPYMGPAIEQARQNLPQYYEESDTLEELVARLAIEIERDAKQRAPVDTGTLRASIKSEKID